MRSFTEIRRGGGFLRSLAKSAICCAVIVSLSTVAGCSDDYDDSQLRGDLSELSGRVEKLEQSVAKLNGDYTALSGIVDALEGKVYVSSPTVTGSPSRTERLPKSRTEPPELQLR